MKRSCKSLFLLPVTALLLSGCQQVMASDHSTGEELVIHQEVENYQQVISLSQRMETEEAAETSTPPVSYTVTEATLFPKTGEGHGTRIIKKNETDPIKWDLYASQNAAYQQKNNGEWSRSATSDPTFATLEVFSYDTFTELAELFLAKGELSENRYEYIISYEGSDPELNTRIASLLNQFTGTDTAYEATITVDKEDRRVTSIDLCMKSQQPNNGETYCQEIEAAFHKFNSNTLPEVPEKL